MLKHATAILLQLKHTSLFFNCTVHILDYQFFWQMCRNYRPTSFKDVTNKQWTKSQESLVHLYSREQRKFFYNIPFSRLLPLYIKLMRDPVQNDASLDGEIDGLSMQINNRKNRKNL